MGMKLHPYQEKALKELLDSKPFKFGQQRGRIYRPRYQITNMANYWSQMRGAQEMMLKLDAHLRAKGYEIHGDEVIITGDPAEASKVVSDALRGTMAGQIIFDDVERKQNVEVGWGSLPERTRR